MKDDKRNYFITIQDDWLNSDNVIYMQETSPLSLAVFMNILMATKNTEGKLIMEIHGKTINLLENKSLLQKKLRCYSIEELEINFKIFEECDLIHYENNVLVINDFHKFVGSKTQWAEWKAERRKELKALIDKEDVEDVDSMLKS